MQMNWVHYSLMFLALPLNLTAQIVTTREARIAGGEESYKFDIYHPTGTPTADFLYNLGMGDTPASHSELFRQMNAEGIRVIVPHHSASLNRETIAKLAGQNRLIEYTAREDSSRPLITGGWSMGGLLAYRQLQDPSLAFFPGRVPSGTLLYAPATHPRYLIGAYRTGILTTGSISNNPSPPNGGRMGIPAPAFQVPFFVANLLYHSRKAQDLSPIAADGNYNSPLITTPMAVFVGAPSGPNRDRSVDSHGIVDHFGHLWNLRSFDSTVRGKPPAPLAIFEYDSPHALDWEADPIGPEVHAVSAEFSRAVIEANSTKGAGVPSICVRGAVALAKHASISRGAGRL